VPSRARYRSLKLRFPQAVWFSLTVAGVGAIGGASGHHLFVHVFEGSLEERAVRVGCAVGLGTSIGTWGLAYLGRNLLGPFEPGPQADLILTRSLPVALISGPAAGALISQLVVKGLKKRFGG
jgi:hypothetical protein